jgi:hypothetical protein
MYIDDTAVYLDIDRKERILVELFHNAFRTIKSVYLFQIFAEYIKQLQSVKQEDKKEVYWNVSYHEKLIDYVKISIAFETFNKAILLQNGLLIHKIKSQKDTKQFSVLQRAGKPINASDFVSHVGTTKDDKNRIFLNGLTSYFETIKYSDTLNENYQAIICLDKVLLSHLKKINIERNRLHFFTDFKGAFEVNSHISKWEFIMKYSIDTIEKPLKLRYNKRSN